MVEAKNGLIQSMGKMNPIHGAYPFILHCSSARGAFLPFPGARRGASAGHFAPFRRISLIHQYHQ
jgi:hypothetical protein